VTVYTCHARPPSTLRLVRVHREKAWPRGARGPAPVAPIVEGQARRGPCNVLVRRRDGAAFVVPARTLRLDFPDWMYAELAAALHAASEPEEDVDG
jgi:hypothetical protein